MDTTYGGERTAARRVAAALISREASKVVLVGLLLWAAGAGLALWGFGALDLGADEELHASTVVLSLVIGFGVASVGVVLYATLRALARPERLAAMLGGAAVFFLPVLGGLVAPALVHLRLADYPRVVLLAAPALLLAYCTSIWLLDGSRRGAGRPGAGRRGEGIRRAGAMEALRRAAAAAASALRGRVAALTPTRAGSGAPGQRS